MPSLPPGGKTTDQINDIVDAMVSVGSSLSKTYDDATGSLKLDLSLSSTGKNPIQGGYWRSYTATNSMSVNQGHEATQSATIPEIQAIEHSVDGVEFIVDSDPAQTMYAGVYSVDPDGNKYGNTPYIGYPEQPKSKSYSFEPHNHDHFEFHIEHPNDGTTVTFSEVHVHLVNTGKHTHPL